MKVVAVGDLHGRGQWKYIVNRHQDADKIIFVGDYWDSFDIPFKEQQNNFLDVIENKKQHPEQTVLLLGNHDVHYLPEWMQMGECYSGFQDKSCFLIRELLQEHRELFKIAHREGEYLFTHAGVTNAWLRRTMGLRDSDDRVELDVAVEDYINDVWKYSPRFFMFFGRDPYGDDPRSSPVWVRPQSLNEDAFPAIHVVGHTSQKRIGIEPTKFREEGSGLFIDTLGSSGEYLIIEDGAIKIESV